MQVAARHGVRSAIYPAAEEHGWLLGRIDEGVATVLALLERLDAQAMARTGHHQTLGEMTVAEIIDRFAVAHLEEHADQLDPGGVRGTP